MLVGFLFDEFEPGLFVEVAGGGEDVVGPEGELAVAMGTGEVDGGLQHMFAEALTAHVRLDVEEAEFGNLGGFLDEEERTDDGTFALRDPAIFELGVEMFQKLRADFGDEALEFFIEPIFARVNYAMAMDDPTDIAGAVWAEGIWRLGHGAIWRSGPQKVKRLRRWLSIRRVGGKKDKWEIVVLLFYLFPIREKWVKLP